MVDNYGIECQNVHDLSTVNFAFKLATIVPATLQFVAGKDILSGGEVEIKAKTAALVASKSTLKISYSIKLVFILKLTILITMESFCNLLLKPISKRLMVDNYGIEYQNVHDLSTVNFAFKQVSIL